MSRGLASMVYNFFDKKSTSFLQINLLKIVVLNPCQISNLQMNFINQLLFNSSFKDNTWGVDLPDMQLISKYSKEIRFLLCAIEIFGKYAWVVPLKYKK